MLDEMIELKEKHDELYKKGFTDINSEGVHVENNFFYKNFDEFEITERDCYQFPLKLVAYYKDVNFHTILDNKEAIKLRNMQRRQKNE